MAKDDNTYTITINPVQVTIVLVVLKFFGQIDWTWAWVFSPVWIFYGGLILLAAIYGIFAAIKEWNENSERR